MLGHKSLRTTEIYVRANKRNISDNLEMVEKKLFDKHGQLPDKSTKNNEGGRVVDIENGLISVGQYNSDQKEICAINFH